MELTRLQAIVDSDNDDLRHLAAIAGGDPATFYRGSDFNGVDLRGIDLRGFNLTGASFRGALVNKKTLVDDAYIKQLKMDTETFKKLHVDLETKEDNLWFEVVTELARRRGKTSHDIINRYLSEAFKFF
ncbi:pentapeptide repeat-containing protein [Dankookia sp. P2]|uniref:pentapeptide repeat-containing protein n=1 Tax=Dankookia sp. P2 TaxID=3423955 RepID=UPI003D66625E